MYKKQRYGHNLKPQMISISLYNNIWTWQGIYASIDFDKDSDIPEIPEILSLAALPYISYFIWDSLYSFVVLKYLIVLII